MSRPGLSDDTTMNTIGTSDQIRISATAIPLPSPMAVRLNGMCQLPPQLPSIASAQQHRDDQHDPGGRGGWAERVEAERFQIEIDRNEFSLSPRAALRHQPHFRKQSEGEY